MFLILREKTYMLMDNKTLQLKLKTVLLMFLLKILRVLPVLAVRYNYTVVQILR